MLQTFLFVLLGICYIVIADVILGKFDVWINSFVWAFMLPVMAPFQQCILATQVNTAYHEEED